MKVSEEIRNHANYKKYTNPAEARGKTYLPEPTGEEKPYILKVKPDAPFKDVFVGQLSFHKVIKSRPKSDGSQDDLCMIRYLSDNQVEALQIQAENKRIKRLDKHEYLTAWEMIELKALPPGEYKETMSTEALRDAFLDVSKEPETPEEIKAKMAELQRKLDEAEKAGEDQAEAEAKAEEQAQQDEEEEKSEEPVTPRRSTKRKRRK